MVTFNGGINTLGMQFQHLCHSFGIYHCFLRKWISCTNCTVVLLLKIIVIRINDVNSIFEAISFSLSGCNTCGKQVQVGYETGGK
jgi:hypothetical protein